VRQLGIRVRGRIVIEEARARNMRRLILGARIALLRRQIPGRIDNRQAGLAKMALQPVRILA
jgi:hypothetical protein